MDRWKPTEGRPAWVETNSAAENAALSADTHLTPDGRAAGHPSHGTELAEQRTPRLQSACFRPDLRPAL